LIVNDAKPQAGCSGSRWEKHKAQMVSDDSATKSRAASGRGNTERSPRGKHNNNNTPTVLISKKEQAYLLLSGYSMLTLCAPCMIFFSTTIPMRPAHVKCQESQQTINSLSTDIAGLHESNQQLISELQLSTMVAANPALTPPAPAAQCHLYQLPQFRGYNSANGFTASTEPSKATSAASSCPRTTIRLLLLLVMNSSKKRNIAVCRLASRACCWTK
jgi:hypothetical protein